MTSAVSSAYFADTMSDTRVKMNEKLAMVVSYSRFTSDQMSDFKRIQLLIQERRYLAASLLLDKLIDSLA